MSNNLLIMTLESLAALAAVLALFAGIIWLIRRLQPSAFSQQADKMKVLRRLNLDTKHSLVEVMCDKHRYLIGLSASGITLLSGHVEHACSHSDKSKTNDNPAENEQV